MKTPTNEEADALAHEIGALFVNFSAFEHTLNLAVAATFSLSIAQSNALIRGMFPRQKIELLSAFAKKHWPKEVKDILGPTVKDALALADYRNDIAHGFIVHDATGKFHTITFRGAHRFEGTSQPLTAFDVGKRVALAMKLALNFQNLADTLIEETARRKASQPQKHPSK